MDRDRLVGESLGKLNRGLLIFRLGLYAAVFFGLSQRGPAEETWLAMAVVAIVAFIPAIPELPRKIEIGVASTLTLELVLSLAYGPFPALQITAMFSVAVAGLFLTHRTALLAVGTAVAFQAITVVAAIADLLPTGGDLADLAAETVLLLAAGIGFIEIGGILRSYQTRLIEQAREELRLTEMIESKDRLIDTIAHEIRTPVTAVLGLSSELSSVRLLDPQEVGEIADLVASESRRLAHLVDNLVLRSRDDIDMLTFRAEQLSLSQVLRSSWRVLGLDASDLVVTGDAEVFGDRERIQHIFVNLFDNAIRHGALPVSIEVSTTGPWVETRLRDAGPGFDTAVSAKAFDRYEGGRDPHRPDHVGLGLPVSRMLAEHMNGGLSVEAEAVVIRLPAALASVPA